MAGARREDPEFELTAGHRRYLRAFDSYLAARSPREIVRASIRLGTVFVEEFPTARRRDAPRTRRKRAA